MGEWAVRLKSCQVLSSKEEWEAQAGASHAAGSLSKQAGFFSGSGLGVYIGKGKPGGFVPNMGGSLSLTSCWAGRFGNSWVGRCCCCPWLLGRWGWQTSLGMHGEVMSRRHHLYKWFCPNRNCLPSDFLQSHQLNNVEAGQWKAMPLRCVSAYKNSFMYFGVGREGRTDHIHYANNNWDAQIDGSAHWHEYALVQPVSHQPEVGPVAFTCQTRRWTVCIQHSISDHPGFRGLLATRLQVTSYISFLFPVFGLYILPLLWDILWDLKTI